MYSSLKYYVLYRVSQKNFNSWEPQKLRNFVLRNYTSVWTQTLATRSTRQHDFWDIFGSQLSSPVL